LQKKKSCSGGISQISTHSEVIGIKGHIVRIDFSILEEYGKLKAHPFPTPQRRIKRVLCKETLLAHFDIDGKMPISLRMTCSKQKALKMPLMQAGRG
jgi:hypothetical protein